MKVLLVEDSPRLQSSIARGLSKSGYAVEVCGNGALALRRALAEPYDVIVLDLLLPGIDGWTLLERLRAAGRNTHVLVLSARDRVEDRVRGLRLGADDYLVKPFDFDELLARIDALTRRGYGRKSPTIEVGDVVIDTGRKIVLRRGEPVDLTAREYKLLEFLGFHLGRTVSREEIETHLYTSEAAPSSNAVDSAVCSVRAKLDVGGEPSLIQTRRGLGYCLGATTPRPVADGERG